MGKKPLHTEKKVSGAEWISYLPEIYDTYPLSLKGSREEQKDGDSFLRRYLGVFQQVYEEMTQRIDDMPHMLYPEHTGRDFLEWLAQWCGIENPEIWLDSQLRYLLLNQSRLSGIRGTRKYMEEMVRLYTGVVPYIVEYYQTAAYRTDIKKNRLLSRLYGSTPYEITVILKKQVIRSHQKMAVLHKIVEASAPAGIICRLIVLQPCIYLDKYSYIGVNSRLAGYGQIRLDDRGLFPYRSVMGEGEEEG